MILSPLEKLSFLVFTDLLLPYLPYFVPDCSFWSHVLSFCLQHWHAAVSTLALPTSSRSSISNASNAFQNFRSQMAVHQLPVYHLHPGESSNSSHLKTHCHFFLHISLVKWCCHPTWAKDLDSIPDFSLSFTMHIQVSCI